MPFLFYGFSAGAFVPFAVFGCFAALLFSPVTASAPSRMALPYDAAAAEAIPAPAADDYSDLYAAITALEEKLRLPVELYYLEGFKTREIAGMLGIPENTVKTRLRAAREHLRKDLKGACFA